MWDWYGTIKGYNALGKIFQEHNPIFIPKRSMKIKNKKRNKRR